ncbi:MAG: MSCRAMM family adhesin SdrC [Chloroflexi bacterium]|nr:MSCRAMM family adhesin SdrC [Chloroflexota bacterium]
MTNRLLMLMLLVAVGVLGSADRTMAQIDHDQPGRSHASLVACLRAGADLALPAEAAPRLAAACFASAWDITAYGQAGGGPLAGDAPGSDPAIITLGDGKPDAAGSEPGHVTLASLAQVGAVYGLAFSSGGNPSATASANGVQAMTTPREPRLFSAAFSRRLTRFGPGGPGAIYATSLSTGAHGIFVMIPAVVPGPATAVTIAGTATVPGDGSATAYANRLPFSATMGGIHRIRGDVELERLASRTGLGDLDIDAQERFLYVVNLAQRRVYRIDSWAAQPQASLTLLPDLVTALRPCSTQGSATYRPFGLHVTSGYVYLGGVCSDEFDGGGDRADVALRVDRWNLAAQRWEPLIQAPLVNYVAQRGIIPGERPYALAWQAWRDAIPTDAYLRPFPAPLVADLALDDRGMLFIGMRDRIADMAGPPGMPVSAARGYGDLMIATPLATGGWAPPTTGSDPTGDDGMPGGADGARHNEALWGGLAWIPGRHDGMPGGEIAVTGLTPYRTNSAGVFWYDAGRGSATAREEIYHESRRATFSKVSGLGDLELLCAWAALGDRVWRDLDGDGLQDAGEPGIDGVRVSLYHASDTSFSTPLATVTTGDADGDGVGGEYRFYVEPFRTYRVRLDPAQFAPGGVLRDWFVTSPDRGASDLLDSDADQISRAMLIPGVVRETVDRSFDVGLAPLSLASGYVGDRVWLDADGDGLQDTGEAGVAQITAELSACQDSVPSADCRQWLAYAPQGGAARGATGTTGAYLFSRLPPNFYRVMFMPPATYLATRRGAGDPARDSDADSTTGWRTAPVRVDSPGGTLHHDLGLLPATANVQLTMQGAAMTALTTTTTYVLAYGVSPGPVGAAGVSIALTIPGGMRFVTATPSPNVSGSTLRWNLANVAAGTSGQIQLVLQATQLGDQVVGARISTTTPGDRPDDNAASVTTRVVRPNARIVLTGPTTAAAGARVTYQATVTNLADSEVPAAALAAADGVIAELTLPTGLDAPTPSPQATISGRTVRWNLGTLTPGASRTLTLQVSVTSVAPVPGALWLSSRITTTSPADDPDDNQDEFLTTVNAPALRVTISDAPDPVAELGRLRYTVIVRNTGSAAAQSSTLSVRLPAAMRYRTATPPPGTVAGQLVSWPLGTVAAGGQLTVVVETQLERGASSPVSTTAQVATGTPGDDPRDNLASATSRIVPVPLPVIDERTTTLVVHSALDPQSGGSHATDAVYPVSGTRFAWPLGEVLDLSAMLAVDAVPLVGEAASLYTQQPSLVAWSLIGVERDGQRWNAGMTDSAGRSGCRERDRAAIELLPGCVFRYVAGGSLTAPQPPVESAMARQAHLLFMPAAAPAAHRDAVMLTATPATSVVVIIRTHVRIDVLNRPDAVLVWQVDDIDEHRITIRLFDPRSVR